MKNKKLITVLAALVLLVFAGLSLSSCSNKITKEQLIQLKDLRKQERILDDKITNQKAELSEIEKEYAARKSVLDDCNKRQDFVKNKLKSWPNIWPDWTPETPAAPVTPTEKK